MRWSGRRSDDDCSRLTEWALPGWYHVAAAALAGEPSDLQFELERPTREVITRTPEPQQDKDDGQEQTRARTRTTSSSTASTVAQRPPGDGAQT